MNDNQNCAGNATVMPKKVVADMKKLGEKYFLRSGNVIDEVFLYGHHSLELATVSFTLLTQQGEHSTLPLYNL
jgi:hypothetical protein